MRASVARRAKEFAVSARFPEQPSGFFGEIAAMATGVATGWLIEPGPAAVRHRGDQRGHRPVAVLADHWSDRIGRHHIAQALCCRAGMTRVTRGN